MKPATSEFHGLVLAAHPTARGFGWVLFEGPRSPVAWGTASAQPSRQSRLVARFERLVARYEPAVFVLEEFEGVRGGRAKRIRDLCRSMLHVAARAKASIRVYPRALVCATFTDVANPTRQNIAESVARRVSAFDHRLPKRRRIWESEDARQCLFDAAALALTFYDQQPPHAPSGASE